MISFFDSQFLWCLYGKDVLKRHNPRILSSVLSVALWPGTSVTGPCLYERWLGRGWRWLPAQHVEPMVKSEGSVSKVVKIGRYRKRSDISSKARACIRARLQLMGFLNNRLFSLDFWSSFVKLVLFNYRVAVGSTSSRFTSELLEIFW